MGLFGKKFKPNIQELYEIRDYDGLIEACKRGDANVRDKAGGALYELIPHLEELEFVETLIEILSLDISELRREAAIALEHIAEKHPRKKRLIEGAVEPLIEALKDKEEYTRACAASTLGVIKDKSAVEPLIKSLREDTDPHMRWMAAQALGEIKDERAVEPLIEALDDRSEGWGAGLLAPSILGEMGDKRALEPLQRLLETEEDKSRRSVIKTAIRKLQK